MAITVYWAPWGRSNYSEQFLSYMQPVKVLDDLAAKSNNQNKYDNFFKCPAFINSAKNTYLFTSPADSDISFTGNQMINHLSENTQPLTCLKAESMLNALTVRYNANWIFFCEEPLYIHATPPYLHKSTVSDYGFYVPGTYDISQWFRPLEYAFQLWEGSTRFKTVQDDPLLYIKFLTDEPVKLQKFYMTDEIYNLSMSCVRLKDYRREKNLFKLYEIFKSSRIKSRILKEINSNLL